MVGWVVLSNLLKELLMNDLFIAIAFWFGMLVVAAVLWYRFEAHTWFRRLLYWL